MDFRDGVAPLNYKLTTYESAKDMAEDGSTLLQNAYFYDYYDFLIMIVSYKDYTAKTCKLKYIQIGVWRLLGYSILTLFVVNLISNFIIYITPETYLYSISREVIVASYTYDKLFILFMGIIFFPLIEELAFSYFLGKRKNQVAVSVSLLLGLFITSLNFIVFDQLKISLPIFFLVWLGSSVFASILDLQQNSGQKS